MEGELSRREQFHDPSLWVERRLGEQFWSAQRRIADSVAKHRRTAVRSCHEVGKSYAAASIAAWWIDRDKEGEAFVVTSAPTNKQVRAILWREMGRVHTRGKLRGRMNQTEWFIRVGDKEELVAFGSKPDDYDPTAFQGIHAPRVLVIFDEACGIPDALWEAADSLIANDESKFVVFGNPDDPATEFYKVCKPGSGWNVVPISAFDSPNFTGEKMPQRVLSQLIGRTYVEEKRKKWAPTWTWTPDGKCVVPPPGGRVEDTNPFWQSKVLGLFPEKSSDGGLIPLSWIKAAQQRTLMPSESDPSRLGVDVGAGGDASCISHAHGPRWRVLQEDHNPDTMITTGNVVHYLEETGARVVNVDEIGIGKGVRDRLAEEGKPVIGINVGLPAFDKEHFVNLRAELYWHLRERFEAGNIDLDESDEDTAAELAELRYKRLSNGKIQIESKDDAKKRGVASPNRAESMMLSYADILPPEEWVIQ